MEWIPTFSRQDLYDLKQQKPYLDIVRMLVKQVAGEAKRGYNTRVVFNPYQQLNGDQSVETLIALLQKYLPDVSIEYKEQTSLNGYLERAIIIDWS